MFPVEVWGTVADWFAAVGTSGALLLGLWLFKTDRDNRSRSHIDGVGIILRRKGDGLEVTLNVGSQHEIIYPELLLLPLAAGKLYKRYRKSMSEYDARQQVGCILWDCASTLRLYDLNVDDGFLEAGSRTVNTKSLSHTRPSDTRLFLVFNDHKGKYWIREWPSGRYVTRKREWRRIRHMAEDHGAWDRAENHMLWLDAKGHLAKWKKEEIDQSLNPMRWLGYWQSVLWVYRKYYRR